MQRSALLISILLVVAAVGPTAGAVAAAGPSESVGTALESHGGDADTCTFPYETTDATGAEVEIPDDPDRVVTLNPSAAQTMWEIGAEDEVVGVSQYATYLDGASAKTNVSGAGGPSVEAVLNTTPDLVLVPNSTHGFAAERVEQIRAQGVPVYVFGEATSLDYVANKTEHVGRLTGNCEAGTERAAEMRRSLELMRQALADEERPVGLNVFYGYTSGANTFIGDVMAAAGLQNGAASAGVSGFQPINDETVVELNPEWIVTPDGSSVPETPAYNSTTAVQEGNVVRVNTNYLQQPAPRSVLAAETILQAVHPDAYEEYRQLDATNGSTETAAPTTEGSETASQTTTAATDTASPTSSTGTPGFGVVAAIAALAAAAALVSKRQ
ncbi:PGF-CTERM-anchored ABC transporter substrate-binding protein [Halobellus clavatus]|jgi:iron complex transport system substrate-binding protein|uniref:Iron complex transport system substrate-binding protein n=1 Tax=Halobellus clavatus TaxID=660517 RepID=A0A1H3I1R5_9EURY|nr:PGF-CTERM-anchored ABC transporter substrate-binding protein [Halobellus clavatus]SDY21048.1 iron complex transport system substrate-binding protein [Halobellus clavatus]